MVVLRINGNPAAIIFLIVVLAVLAFVFYRLVRLAVRHGIEDAWRRRRQAQAEAEGWDPARS